MRFHAMSYSENDVDIAGPLGVSGFPTHGVSNEELLYFLFCWPEKTA